MDLYEHLKT